MFIPLLLAYENVYSTDEISLPFLIRFRQCVLEYTQTTEPSRRNAPFWNACKYLSALPVVATGYYMSECLNAIRLGFDTSSWNTRLVFWLWYASSHTTYDV